MSINKGKTLVIEKGMFYRRTKIKNLVRMKGRKKNMTKYENLIEKSERCIELAKSARERNDENLVMFYKNVSEGFEVKAKKLDVGDLA